MRRKSIGIAPRSGSVTETAAIDLFSTLFLVATLMIAPRIMPRQVEATAVDALQTRILLNGDGAFIGADGPFSDQDVVQRLGQDKRQVRVRVGQGVSVEREHAFLVVLTANPTVRVTIDLAGIHN